ncbi:helix-turn-helix domain-containing protein [Streptomyces hesseae]|uniref:Helix-turn-helix domain-containing protein n=1 Tax=Streptomyces hesseae TaxID=3075519 RepID=A0ABU2SNV4_9ACTN|nr:helix-turn-helix domain-containing protein [Streptomyces sp. DSM 40473]MDT0450662.1 helix-turn-helix domain-containing protein [Streptomyces sp. DSM 40473]
MSRWKELPASLDQRVRQLVVQLRRLKDRSGLSLAALAAKTSYSSSSWERYLNGKQLPPRDAVEELARVCGADTTRLLVLHEVAAEAWTDEAAETEEVEEAGSPAEGLLAPGEPTTPPAGDGARTGPRSGPRSGPRRTTTVVLAAAVVALTAALVAVLLVTRPWQDDGTAAGHEHAVAGNSTAPFVFVQGRSRPCDVKRHDGDLRAGYSATRTTLMDLKSTGWEVLEAQCLLRYHGFDPGISDGSYGERSKNAAKAFQKARGLVVDGIVGPDTWQELRR